jgi:hypothetical protein
MTMVVVSIRAADISAFVDIPTLAVLEKYLLALVGQLQITGCQVLTNVGSLGMDLAIPAVMMQRKEVRNMKIATSFLAAVLFTGTLGALNNAIAEDGILSKDNASAGSYCHEKFPAMKQGSLDDNRPALQPTTDGPDIVDYYGPCDETPAGKDQILTQKLEHQHRMEGSTAGESDRFD